jgi:hypothetical protein
MRRFYVYLLLACSSIFLVMAWFRAAQAAPIDAAAATPGSVLSQIFTEALKIIVAIAVPLVLALVHRGLSVLKEKTGIDIPAQQEQLIDRWVDQAVHLAEERARKWMTEQRFTLPSGSKANIAIDFVWDHVQRAGLVDWSRDQLVAKIEAKVNSKRRLGATPPPLPPAP